jgi:hypothetical protein
MTYYLPSDARNAHPEIDPSHSIPLTQFQGLVEPYLFPEIHWVECQLEHEGVVCRQRHGNGWIAKRLDGIAGFIGHVCARHHCHANRDFATKFQQEARRIAKRNRIADLVTRITAYKQTDGLADELLADISRYERHSRYIFSTRRALPRALHDRLMDMVKTGRRNIDALSKHSAIEVDKNGQQRERVWFEPFVLGAVSAPDALDPNSIRDLGTTLNAAEEALRLSEPDANVDEKVLKQWLGRLRCLRSAERHSMLPSAPTSNSWRSTI